MAGGVLPEQFWTPNNYGVMGGIELGFMSTTTDRDVALMYMKQSGKAAKMIFEIRMGMIDRGAVRNGFSNLGELPVASQISMLKVHPLALCAQDVSLLSQFPGEKEILFAPLTGLEVASVPRVEGDVIVVELRLSCNLHDQTLEDVIGKMRTSHIMLVENMMSKFAQIDAPPACTVQLQELQDLAKVRGREFFNVPELFLRATREVLEAASAGFSAVGEEQVWSSETGDNLASRMLEAARLCVGNEQHKAAAKILTLAVARCTSSDLILAWDEEKVQEAIKTWSGPNYPGWPTAEQVNAMRASSFVRKMADTGDTTRWGSTSFHLAETIYNSGAAVQVGGASGSGRKFSDDATPIALHGSAVLHASHVGDVDGLKTALMEGGDANYSAENGVTPLMLAESPKCIKVLLEAGAAVNAVSRRGYTPLTIAVHSFESAMMLIQQGADVNTIREGFCTHLGAAIASSESMDEGEGLLLVQAMLDAGADVNARGRVSFEDGTPGSNALLGAAYHGNLAMVHLLMGANADINQAADNGTTPLMYAAFAGHQPVVECLVESGASLERGPVANGIEPVPASSALILAEHAGHRRILAYLRQRERALRG